MKPTLARRHAPARRVGASSRLAVAGLAVGLVVADASGVIAAGGTSHSPGNAAVAQYRVSGVGAHRSRQLKHATGSKIHIHVPPGRKLKTVTVTVDGKTVLALNGKNARADVVLPCSKRARNVVVIAVTDTGKRITEQRRVDPCSTSSSSKRPAHRIAHS
jgi:hypothetical protein